MYKVMSATIRFNSGDVVIVPLSELKQLYLKCKDIFDTDVYDNEVSQIPDVWLNYEKVGSVGVK